MIGSLIAKQKMESKLRADFTSMLLGKKPSNQAVQKPSTTVPKLGGLLGKIGVAKLNTEDTQNSSRLSDNNPPMIDVAGVDNSDGMMTTKIKPNMLARRRERRMLTLGARKGSKDMLMNSLHRSSKMSITSKD